MAVCSFIIHLERATARRGQVDRLLSVLPAPGEILSAKDGRGLTRSERSACYRRFIHRPRYPFELSDGEVACFLSHRKAWQAILDRGLDGALVVEDDVDVSQDGFPQMLDAIVGLARPDDYVRFPRWERGETGPAAFATPSGLVIEPFLPGLGMQMQYVAREAARKLLAASQTFDRPVDSLVQMQWLHGARVLSARPLVIREIDLELGGTVLQRKEMPFAEKLLHELRRPFLRFAIRRLNRRWRNESGHQ